MEPGAPRAGGRGTGGDSPGRCFIFKGFWPAPGCGVIPLSLRGRAAEIKPTAAALLFTQSPARRDSYFISKAQQFG